jgi:plastocyanin
MSFARLVVLLVAAVLTLGLVACGDDDDDDSDGVTAAATAPATDGEGETAAATPGSAGNEFTPPPGGSTISVDVTAEDFAFDPSEITVPAGEPVTFRFTNAGAAPHTFTLYLDEEFEDSIANGTATTDEPEITVSFVDPGEYYFRCEVHPNEMQGVLTAE